MLKCGVAGLGRGKLFAKIFESLPECTLVAVCDSNPDALSGFEGISTHTDYESFLSEGLDVVAVITPGPGHAGQSVRALESGAHVLCETPCVYSAAEASDVVEAVRKSGRQFMLAENYIWMGWALAVRERMDAIGEVVYAEGDYTHDCRDLMLVENGSFVPYAERAEHPGAAKSWRATNLPPLTYSSHTLGPLLHLANDRVKSCYGLGTGTRTAPDLGTIDLETGLFTTEKGAIIRLTNGFTVTHPMALHYKIIGTRGSILVQSYTGAQTLWYSDTLHRPSEGWQTIDVGFAERPDGRGSTEVMVEDFVRSLLDGSPPPFDVHASLDMVLPGCLAHESAQAGGTVLEVPSFR